MANGGGDVLKILMIVISVGGLALTLHPFSFFNNNFSHSVILFPIFLVKVRRHDL